MPSERARMLRRRRTRRAALARLRGRLRVTRSSDERRRIAEKMTRRAPQRRGEFETLAAERPVLPPPAREPREATDVPAPPQAVKKRRAPARGARAAAGREPEKETVPAEEEVPGT